MYQGRGPRIRGSSQRRALKATAIPVPLDARLDFQFAKLHETAPRRNTYKFVVEIVAAESAVHVIEMNHFDNVERLLHKQQ